MIVLDASVMIAALDRTDAHSEVALALLARFADQRTVAHRLSIAETLVQPARSGRASEVSGSLDAFGVGRIDEPDDPIRSAELRTLTRLPIPDCVVLIAAHRAGATLATFDRRLAAAARDQGVPVVDGA